jgi:hypothetical protein
VKGTVLMSEDKEAQLDLLYEAEATPFITTYTITSASVRRYTKLACDNTY